MSAARPPPPKASEGVYQELYGIFLAHYAVWALMAAAAMQAHLDPDRLSFTEGLFHLTEMIDLAPQSSEELLKRNVLTLVVALWLYYPSLAAKSIVSNNCVPRC